MRWSRNRGARHSAAYDQAFIAFGCHPETMRKHYLQLDETAIADAVFDKIQADGRGIGVNPDANEARPE
ncbi:MAG: hypothetical protein JWN86_2770 [Planctomycetota bacterium]|nr:hypothetical protein [Planctomycetota bacterium]